MLSQIQKLEDLLILWPFNKSVLDTKLPLALNAELNHLIEYEKQTQKLHYWPEDTETF